MKETRPEKVEKARQVLEELKQLRGGSVISAHKRMANDPELLETFTYNFQHCSCWHWAVQKERLPPLKYMEIRRIRKELPLKKSVRSCGW